MSLINDALKKAQKQRTGEAPPLASMPSVGGESPQRIAKRAKPAGFDTMMVRAGIGGAVVLVLAVGGFFLLRPKPETGNLKPESSAATPGQPSQVAPPSGNPAPASNANAQVATVPAAPAPTFTLPVAPKPEPATSKTEPPPTSIAKANTPKTETPQVSGFRSQVSEPAKPVPAPAVERPKVESRAVEFIENIKVAGIRASATDAKVLMNDRVYRPGSLVSAEFGLKLVEITSNSLTFEDDRGGRYTRTF